MHPIGFVDEEDTPLGPLHGFFDIVACAAYEPVDQIGRSHHLHFGSW